MIAAGQTEAEVLLLVDSDSIPRATIAEYLRQCGYRVIEAADAAEALLALEHDQVDIVVADVELRGEPGGFTLAQWIRRNLPRVRLVLTSSVERSAEAAGDLCEDGPTLSKPYHPQLLIDHIKRLGGRR